MIMKSDNAPLTLEQQREFYSRVICCLPTDITWKETNDWMKNPKDLAKFFSGLKKGRVILGDQTEYVKKLLAIQQNRYQDIFQMEFDFSNVPIPPMQPGLDRLLVMQEGFGPNKYYEASERYFSCWKYTDDLDEATRGRNEREWDKTYAIWVRSRKEADEELKNLSANTLKKKKIKTITLAERIWFGLDWYIEKKEHLDEQNITLCAGSRVSDGDVQKFFDNMSHGILFNLIKKEIKNKEALRLINLIIKSFEKNTNKGIPLGNVTSQLFTNIYLNKLNQFIKHELRIRYYIRYCDDFIILSKDKFCLGKIVKEIDAFLRNNLKLNLHPNKIKIRKVSQGIGFLGYITFYHHRILRRKTKRRILRKIRIRKAQFDKGFITKRSFEQTLNSYFGVLKHCEGSKIRGEINKIIDKE